MLLSDVLTALNAAGSAATIGSAIATTYAWLRERGTTGIDSRLHVALDHLPSNASPADIVRVVEPFINSGGGSISLSAGADGGGSFRADGVSIQGGAGKSQGGDVTIKAGDGGPHGPGGDFTITGGSIKGGDAG